MEISFVNDPALDSVVAYNPPKLMPLTSFLITNDFTFVRGIKRRSSGQIYHFGLDVACNAGTPIVAPLKGVVLTKGREPGGGRYVEFRPYNSLFTFTFRHLSRFGNTGTHVELPIGTVLGYVGSDGTRSTGNHMHLELRYDKKIVDPLTFISLT